MNVKIITIQYLKYILFLVFLVISQTLLSYTLPVIIRDLIDSNSTNVNTFNSITVSIVLVMVIITINIIIKLLTTLLKLKFSIQFKVEEGGKLYNDLFNVKNNTVRNKDTLYFLTRIHSTIDQMFDVIGTKIPIAVVSASSIIIGALLIANISYLLLICFLCIIPIFLVGYKMINKNLQEKSIVLQKKSAENYKDIANTVKGIETIKQLANNTWFCSNIKKYLFNIEDETNKVNFYAQTLSYALEYVIEVFKLGVLFFSIYMYLVGKITFGDILFIEMIKNIYFQSLNELKNINIGLRDIKASLIFIHEEIIKEIESDGETLIDNIDNIELTIKEFTYNKDVVLKNVNLMINKGEKIALVGKSGCGKSTLIKSMIRLNAIEGVYINSVPIEKINLKSLRSKVYIVNQNIDLFPGSIEDNIVVGLEIIDKDRLDKIKKMKFLREFTTIEDGFDTYIRENGVNFSGGQKQKIAIARLLMHEPDIIVFDESTSAIDSDAEKQLNIELKDYLENKTVIKISHRFSSIKDMDRVVFIEQGKVLEDLELNYALNSVHFNNLYEDQLTKQNIECKI